MEIYHLIDMAFVKPAIARILSVQRLTVATFVKGWL
jgi:hypothetical protein